MQSPKEPAIRTIMMPRDTNAYGFIFGGVILSQIDLAAAVEARKHTRKNIVTVAIKEVKFIAPVHVGDLVSCYTEVLATGNTSITIGVKIKAERIKDGYHEPVDVTEATVVYVAVDEQHRPVPINDP